MRTSLVLASLAVTTATAAAQPAPAPQPAPQPYPAPAPQPSPAPQPYAQPAPAPYYAPPPPPVGPEREGFTAEVSLGLGITSITPEGSDGVSRTGLSGLNIGLGGWISPRTALTVRIAGTSFTENDVQFIAGMLGISAQQMVGEAAWLGGGLGIGVLTTDQENSEGDRGLGLDLRAGYNFYQSRKNAFNVQVELTPGFFDGGRVTGIGFQLGWQHL